MRSNHQDLKSYRQRRALSKNNHKYSRKQFSSTPDTKSLLQIEETLKGQMGRLSFDHNKSMNDLHQSEDSVQDFKGRLSTDQDNVEKDEVSIAKIIMKYGCMSAQITEVNEDDICLSKIIQIPKIQKDKASTLHSFKNIALVEKKPYQSKPTQSKFLSKPDISTMVTPRKTAKQQTPKVISSLKTQKKPIQRKQPNKLQQNRVIKKIELLDEEIMKGGFAKEKEVREEIKRILELLKQG